MKYFTPDLFLQVNSADSDVADAGIRAWEAASEAYSKYVKGVQEKLPAAVRAFMRGQNLHDAELLPARLQAGGFAPFWIRTGVGSRGIVSDTSLSFRQAGAELTLEYKHLLAEPSIRKPVHAPIFSDQNTACLYDEFAVGKGGSISHEILFGNGYVVTIAFRQFSFFERRILEAQVLQSEPSRERGSLG